MVRDKTTNNHSRTLHPGLKGGLMPTDNNKSLIQSLLAANQEKEAVIQHLLRRREIDKMMLLPRYEYVNRALIGEIVNDVCKIIGGQ